MILCLKIICYIYTEIYQISNFHNGIFCFYFLAEAFLSDMGEKSSENF